MNQGPTTVYSLFNPLTGQSYYGITQEDAGKNRLKHHYGQLKRGVHKNRELQEVWDKEGECFFLHILAVTPTLEAATVIERALIALFPRCYNIYLNPAKSRRAKSLNSK